MFILSERKKLLQGVVLRIMRYCLKNVKIRLYFKLINDLVFIFFSIIINSGKVSFVEKKKKVGF